MCRDLVDRNMLCIKNDKYELTSAGRARAEQFAKMMDKGANIIENQFLSPSAAARNTIFTYIFLSAMKLAAGFFGGSVGLISDGADTSVDTASAGVVWLGIRLKKELLGTVAIITLMFATAATLVYESANSILENVGGTILPMSMPYIVILVECVALVSALISTYYQRFVGKRSRSLALISQSIDSKNSVYSAAAVIIGAVFAIFGIYWVDAIAGGFIAIRITWDSIGLSREAYGSFKGVETDFSKYKMPFQEKIHDMRLDTLRTWMLYAIQQKKAGNKQEILTSLQKTFNSTYMPELFSEFFVGKAYDFEGNFHVLVQPLIEESCVLENNGTYSLTEEGNARLKNALGNLRYPQTEL